MPIRSGRRDHGLTRPDVVGRFELAAAQLPNGENPAVRRPKDVCLAVVVEVGGQSVGSNDVPIPPWRSDDRRTKPDIVGRCYLVAGHSPDCQRAAAGLPEDVTAGVAVEIVWRGRLGCNYGYSERPWQ